MRPTDVAWKTRFVIVMIAGTMVARAEDTDRDPQYESGSIRIPAASANEPKRAEFSGKLAERYLTDGALAWVRKHQCVSCHTNGSYLAVRGALTDQLGPPPVEMRTFFVEQSRKLKGSDKLRKGATGTAIAYIALGLSEWDAHVTKTLSPETEDTLRVMLTGQLEDGSWSNDQCWPPLESSNYHSATVAALAIATAPGWLDDLGDDDNARQQIDQLKQYLCNTEPTHDYARLLLLWVATRMKGLINAERTTQIIETVWSHQRPDGGWSLRTFALPEQWGSGNRATRVREEPDFNDPPSDGHMTGLAVMVLRDAGISVEDKRIQAAVNWLKTNQRETGRWWTRSLNTDTYHYITFSGTGYALLALAKCDEL